MYQITSNVLYLCLPPLLLRFKSLPKVLLHCGRTSEFLTHSPLTDYTSPSPCDPSPLRLRFRSSTRLGVAPNTLSSRPTSHPDLHHPRFSTRTSPIRPRRVHRVLSRYLPIVERLRGDDLVGTEGCRNGRSDHGGWRVRRLKRQSGRESGRVGQLYRPRVWNRRESRVNFLRVTYLLLSPMCLRIVGPFSTLIPVVGSRRRSHTFVPGSVPSLKPG